MDTAPYFEVRVTQRFSVQADRVFNAWIDPAIAGKWLFATALRPIAHVEIDARVGGSFRFEDRRNGEAVIQTGKYVEIARPRRLVFTLSGQKRRRGRTCVTIEIVPLENGCELTLTHGGLPPDDASHTEGRWTGMLYGLDTMLGRGSERAGSAVDRRNRVPGSSRSKPGEKTPCSTPYSSF